MIVTLNYKPKEITNSDLLGKWIIMLSINDGVPKLVCHGGVPLAFKTKEEADDYIKENYES